MFRKEKDCIDSKGLSGKIAVTVVVVVVKSTHKDRHTYVVASDPKNLQRVPRYFTRQDKSIGSRRVIKTAQNIENFSNLRKSILRKLIFNPFDFKNFNLFS